MKKTNLKYKPCSKCRGTGKVKAKEKMLDTPDVKRMLRIMKRNGLNQLALSRLIGINQGTINGWFYKFTNKQGLIKKIYFELLANKGIK